MQQVKKQQVRKLSFVLNLPDNWIRAHKWFLLIKEENLYETVSETLHGRFCPPPHHDPTWHSKDLADGEFDPMIAELEIYRKKTRDHMMTFNTHGNHYFRTLIPAWVLADANATSANSSHTLKKQVCEGKKKLLETASCARAEHLVEFIKNFEEDWTNAEDIFNKTKESIVISEKDRIREIVTLGMVQCLLEKIQSKNGTACKTSGEADDEINDCETQNINTTRYEIDYACSPEKPVHPVVKVFPGQQSEFRTHYYSKIESHGFCFSADKFDTADVVTPVTTTHETPSIPEGRHLSQFPMDDISTVCSFVTFGNDPRHVKPVFQHPYALD